MDKTSDNSLERRSFVFPPASK